MSRRKLTKQALDLSLAVPQVVAHRVGRMAAAGATPNARDRKEFQRMGAEKVAAFCESWAAMGMAAMQAQQSMWRGVMFAPLSAGRLPTNTTLANQTLRILSQGLAPVHRRAVGNAKRLKRTR